MPAASNGMTGSRIRTLIVDDEPVARNVLREELELIEDATNHGWGREVERHRGTVRRIEQLLAELSEPVEEATPSA